MIDKKTAARRLIHAAIRNIALDECPVANHVVVMSAHDLLRDYGAKKRLDFPDLLDYVKEEYAKEAIAQFKKGWYFLKHSKTDADDLYDESNLRQSNEFITVVNSFVFASIFRVITAHMQFYQYYRATVTPGLLKDEHRAEYMERPIPAKLASLLPVQRARTFKAALYEHPDLLAERAEDLS